MDFSERLRYLLDCAEITLKDLAPKLGVSPSALGNYARGCREPDFETVKRIADYFGVTTDYLLAHEVKKAAEDEAELLRLVRQFTPVQKAILLEQARVLARYRITEK